MKKSVHHQKGSPQMRRKFALLTLVGALFALAIPASSMAATVMTPNNTEFFIEGTSTPSVPTIKTAYGSCSIKQIRSITPLNGEKNTAMPATIIPGTCSSGASIAFSGKWTFKPYTSTLVELGAEARGLTLRFSSLPGCKLSSTPSSGTVLYGKWTNGASGSSPSTFGAAAGYRLPLFWESETQGSCAKAGTREASAAFESPGTLGYSYVKSFGVPGSQVRTVEVPN
jgi:hypothetical protein